MNFRHSFVGNVLDGCRGGQGEDARRFCIRFELPQWNPWRFWMRFGLPRRTTGGFSFVLDWLAKSLAEIRVFSKWLAENGALNDCFPPFFVREIAIHLRLYVKSPFIGGRTHASRRSSSPARAAAARRADSRLLMFTKKWSEGTAVGILDQIGTGRKPHVQR